MWIVTHRWKLCVFLLLVIVALLSQFWSKQITTHQARLAQPGGIDNSIPLCKNQSKLSIYYKLARNTVKWQFIAHGAEAKNCTLPNGAVCELTDE